MICFDRDTESADLWRHFLAGHNLLMLAPRRIGKTVLLNRLRDEAAEHGFRAIVLDVQGYCEEKDFFRQLCAAIQEEQQTGKRVMTALGDRLSRLLRGGGQSGDWRRWLSETDWQEFADYLLAHLADHGEDPPWLILVDELPIFVQALQIRDGAQAIGGFLYWLRNMRHKYPQLRWLYTGSIGLDSVARRHGVEGALNDLESFPLGPFPVDTAKEFLADIARRRVCDLEPPAAEAIVRRLSWLAPYYLEKIAEDACNQVDCGQTITAEHAHRAMDRMLELSRRTYWSTWREHLDRNFLEPERGRLYRVLETVARAETGAGKDVLLAALNRGGTALGEGALRDLLDTLVADGYLDIDAAHRCHFRMNLLREWWLRYVVL